MDEEQKHLEESGLNLPEIHSYEDYDHLQAKHRASVLWLLSKAYNSKIPSHLREPYYKDNEDHGKLKPQIIHALASAELYCLALSNIYADPNYNSLNHHGVIQTLIRKGIYVVEPTDVALNETVLVQTAPIKMNAHLTVIEGIMALYIKEVLIPEKIVEVVRRFSRVNMNYEMPSDPEETAILWINKCCIKLRHQIEEELGVCHSPDEPGISELHPLVPSVPVLQDLTDLSDGCCLAAVISLYCPNYLKWQDICLNEPMSLADCVYNLQLVEQFCQDHLPCDIHFLTLEDFLYLHSSIKQNALAFVADLLYLFEIWPAKCVIQPGSNEEEESRLEQAHHSHNGQIESQPLSNKIQHIQHSWSPVPNLRAGAYGGSTCSLPDMRISSRSNGAQHRDKHEKQTPKKNIPDGSHNSPALHLRRTNSVNIPDADKIESKTYSQGISSGSTKNTQDQKLWSDEDGESASYLIKHQDEYCISGSETPPSSPLIGNKIRKSRDREYATILPARAKEPKERNNHDSKVLERGEEKPRKPNVISSLPAHLLNNEQYPTEIRLHDKGYGSPKHVNRHIDSSEEDMLWKQKELEESYSKGKFIPSSHSTTETKKDNEQSTRRQSTGLEDYYNQLASEGDSIDENKKIALEFNTNNRHIKNWENRFDEQKLLDKMEYLEEKAALETLDPYKTGIYIDDKDHKSPFTTTSFAQLSKLKETNNSAINIVYMQHEKDRNPDNSKNPLKSSFLQKSKEKSKSGEEKKTTFAVLPNTTTWQQQYANSTSSPQADSGHETPTESGEPPITTQLCNIRLKLEERRRKIEQDKRRMETLWKKQRQRLGKAAFLQAVSKGNGSGAGTPDSGTGKESELETLVSAETAAAAQVTSPSLTRQLSIQEIVDDLDSVRKKWLEQNESVVHPQTLERLEREEVEPDEENIEDFQTSIDQLNTSLNDLQADISRLSHQQDLIQRMMKNSVDNQQQEQSQFFLHSQKQSSQHFQKPFVPVNQGPPPSQWVESSTYPHQPQPDASPRRTQWNHSVHDHHQQHVDHPTVAQQQQWQSPSIISGRPSSVEPQMMGGHPVPTQMHFEQRPPSAVPFDSRAQSFALHTGQPDGFAGYQYGNPPVSRYQNGPTEDSLPCQYGVPPYTVPSSHQYDMSQTHHPQYGGIIYTSPPPSLPNLPPPQQQVPYHLTQEPNIVQQHSVPPVSLPHTQAPLTKRFELQQPSSTGTLPINTEQHIGKPDIKNTMYATTESKEFQYNKAMQSGRTDGEQISMPPSKPVIHKTYRISKAVSPPPLVTQSANQDGSGEQVAQLPVQPIKGSEENEKGFYISFDDDQPRKPKPKLRPRLLRNNISTLKTEKDLVNGQAESTSFTNKSPSASEQRLKDVQLDQTDNPTEGKHDDSASTGLGFVIGADLVNPDPEAENEMARRKEMIMMISLRRRAEQEAKRIAKEQEYAQQREQERLRREMTERKKEEDRLRRQIILEQHRQRKAQEEAEKEGVVTGGTASMGSVLRDTSSSSRSSSLKPKSRSTSKPRPKSVHVSSAGHDHSTSFDAHPSLNRNSQLILTGRDYHDFDSDSLNSVSTTSSRHPTSPTQPSSGSSAFSLGLLVGGRGRGTGPPSDGASDTASTTSSALAAEYTGPKLFVKPTAKSNRGIIVNAVNTVLAGAVNSETKRKVLEEINRSESKHFLILFRDAGCQFRALYSYNPDRDDVIKMYGIGPKMVTDHMMDKFYKYNSGGKCFTEVKTKHLTVTIDAFTIHNSLWAGKKVIPPKKDFL